MKSQSEAAPNCVVCNLPSKGIHYGVPTCIKCCDFFRKHKKPLLQPCTCDGAFENGFVYSKTCATCRLKKSVEVGMKYPVQAKKKSADNLSPNETVSSTEEVKEPPKKAKKKRSADNLMPNETVSSTEELKETPKKKAKKKTNADILKLNETVSSTEELKETPKNKKQKKTEKNERIKKSNKDNNKNKVKRKTLKISTKKSKMEADSLILIKKEQPSEEPKRCEKRSESTCSEFDSFNPHSELDYEYVDDDLNRSGIGDFNGDTYIPPLLSFDISNCNILYEFPSFEYHSTKVFDGNSCPIVFSEEEIQYMSTYMKNKNDSDPKDSNVMVSSIDPVLEENCESVSILNDLDWSATNENETLDTLNLTADSLDVIMPVTQEIETVDDMLLMKTDNDALSDNSSCFDSLTLSDIDGSPEYNNFVSPDLHGHKTMESIPLNETDDELLINDFTDSVTFSNVNSISVNDYALLTSSRLQPYVYIERLSDADILSYSTKTRASEMEFDQLSSSSSSLHENKDNLNSPFHENNDELHSSSPFYENNDELRSSSPFCENNDDLRSIHSDSDFSETRAEVKSSSMRKYICTSPLRNFKIPKKSDTVNSKEIGHKVDDQVSSEDKLNDDKAGIDDILVLEATDRDFELDSNVSEALQKITYKDIKNDATDEFKKPFSKENKTEVSHPFSHGKSECAVKKRSSEEKQAASYGKDTKKSDKLKPNHLSEENDENRRIKRGYCYRSIISTCNNNKCRFCHLPLEDERISSERCYEFFCTALNVKKFSDVLEVLFDAIKKKNDRFYEKKAINDLLATLVHSGKNPQRIVKFWPDVERLKCDEKPLIKICCRLRDKEHELMNLLTYLQEKNEWFQFWKVVQCTINSSYRLPLQVVCSAMKSIIRHPQFISVSVQLMWAQPRDVWLKINVTQWDRYLRNVDKHDSRTAAVSLRNKLLEYSHECPQMYSSLSQLLCDLSPSPQQIPSAVDSRRTDLPLLPLSSSLSINASERILNESNVYPENIHMFQSKPAKCLQQRQQPKNHMTFHVNQDLNQTRTLNTNSLESNLPYRNGENDYYYMEEKSPQLEWNGAEQIKKVVERFLINLSNVQNIGKCLDELHRFFISNISQSSKRFLYFMQSLLSMEISRTKISRMHRYLGQIGILLFLELRKNERPSEAFEVLVGLHKSNINYLELQDNAGHQSEITRTKLALAVLNVCLSLKKYVSALNVLKASEWALPCCNKRVHFKERILRLKLLRDLFYFLIGDHQINDANVILTKLFDSHLDDMKILKQDYLLNMDLGALCDELILNCVNRKEVGIGVTIYRRARDFNMTLEHSSLRGLFVLCTIFEISTFCESMYFFCCSSGIYPQQNYIDWPWCVKIYSYFTLEEICFIFRCYLSLLANYLNKGGNHPPVSEEKKVLKINIEELSSSSCEGIEVLNVPSTLESVTERIMTVASQKLKPPLRVIPKGNNSNRILEVTSITLRNYLFSLGLEPSQNDVSTVSSVPYLWSSFKKPHTKKNTGYVNPFF